MAVWNFDRALTALKKHNDLHTKDIPHTEDYSLIDYIDSLSYEDRIRLRDRATSIGIDSLPRNLFYDYEKQVWIVKPGGKL